MKNIEGLLNRYSKPVPRYTSYPTAPHFTDGLGLRLIDEVHWGVNQMDRVSLYLHIPFCDRLCWFCGCHTKQTNRYTPVSNYVTSLIGEMKLHARHFEGKPLLGTVHFGGGSPSMLSETDFDRINSALNRFFIRDSHTEISVELDPNDLGAGLLRGLTNLGVTRASIGVQDFDEQVQKAINRPQSFSQTREMVEALRGLGIKSVNLDALYGLPLQDTKKLQSTVRQMLLLTPERIALFGYAHIPWMKKHQTMIRDSDLPGTMERFEQARIASEMLVASGYQAIGIDHFALPDDKLAIAATNGTLHRNFQGYTTDDCPTLIGMGASSIGGFNNDSGAGYVQNLVPTGQYNLAVANGKLPVFKGYRLSNDDIIRRWMIEKLMCNLQVSSGEMIAEFGARAMPYIEELANTAAGDTDELCQMKNAIFSILPDARAFTRIVAARFDAYFQKSAARYSQAV
jgi:oxygen-independent coproporphyrinogen-3 oxidase